MKVSSMVIPMRTRSARAPWMIVCLTPVASPCCGELRSTSACETTMPFARRAADRFVTAALTSEMSTSSSLTSVDECPRAECPRARCCVRRRIPVCLVSPMPVRPHSRMDKVACLDLRRHGSIVQPKLCGVRPNSVATWYSEIWSPHETSGTSKNPKTASPPGHATGHMDVTARRAW